MTSELAMMTTCGHRSESQVCGPRQEKTLDHEGLNKVAPSVPAEDGALALSPEEPDLVLLVTAHGSGP